MSEETDELTLAEAKFARQEAGVSNRTRHRRARLHNSFLDRPCHHHVHGLCGIGFELRGVFMGTEHPEPVLDAVMLPIGGPKSSGLSSMMVNS